MDITQLAIQKILQHFGGSVSESNAKNAIMGLLGDGKGGFDIASLVGQFANSESLGGIVSSWLSDGENKGIDVSQIQQMFGAEKLSSFASNLGVDESSANQGLSNILPALIDKSSSGGSLLDSVGGLGGALSMAKKFF